MKLAGRKVLLTGAARGIGQVTALELATHGCDIIGIDLKVDDMIETAAAIKHMGRKFCSLECDISRLALAREIVTEAERLSGGIDILINNAGVLPSGPFIERDFSVWQRTIDINLIAMMNLTHAILPAFIERRSGHIVNIASIAGKFGSEGVVAYAASKHGVVGFSSGLRAELEGANIGVSWICPSPARTRMAKNVSHTFLTPLIEPEDVARAVRRAIERNAIEVFVPGSIRFTSSVLPSLAPRFSRWLARVMKASQGWTLARQELQVK